MAGKVNTKFIMIAGGAMALVIVALLFVGAKMFQRSAADHARRGDEAMAAGDIREAVQSYSRAVNEDQKNMEYLAKWVGAMERWTPTTRQRYIDNYRQQYMAGLNAMAAASAGEDAVKARTKVLEINLRQIRLGSSGSLAAWESLEQLANSAREDLGDTPGADAVLKYRGIARLGKLRLSEPTAESFAAAAEDLNKSLAADPGDQDTMVALYGVESARATWHERRNEHDKAREALEGIGERLRAFADEHAPAPDVLYALLRLRLAQTALKAGQTGERITLRDELPRHADLVKELAESIRQTPPKDLDISTVIAASYYLPGVMGDDTKTADELIGHAAEGQDANASLQIILAKREIASGKYEEAVARLQKVSELPDLPMSLDGLLLYEYRTEAVRQQAEAMLTAWDAEQDAAKRTEFAKRARGYRDEVAKLTGEGDTALLLLDARLALSDGDAVTARKLLSQYSDRTANTDPSAALLLGEVLRRQGNLGAAKDQFERVLELDPSNVRAAASLGDVCLRMNDYPGAAAAFARAAELRPDSELFKNQAEVSKKMLAAGQGDPVLGPLMRWESLTQSVTPDLDEAERVLREALPGADNDPRLLIALAQTLARKGDRAGALAVVRQGLEKSPNVEILKQMEQAFSTETPLADTLKNLESNEKLTPVQKKLAEYQLYMNSGDRDKAHAALDEAGKLDPKDPTVIDVSFQQALLDGDLEKARQWAKAAKENDIDKAGGATYTARMQLMDKQFDDAAATALGIVENDKFNLLGWRILGATRLEQGRAVEAVDAFEKALGVRPDDIASVRGKIRALTAASRVGEALQFARFVQEKASSDPEFVDMWLQLEARASGGNRDRAIEVREGLAQSRPDDLDNKAALATLYMQERRFDDAQKVIDEIAAKRPGETAMRLKATLAVQQGKPDEAARLCTDFLASLPAERQTAEAVVATSQLMGQLGMIEKSLELLEQNRDKQKPETMLIDRACGQLYFTLGRFEDAAKAFERVLGAIKEDPKFAMTKAYAESLMRQGKFEEAQKALSRMGDEARKDGEALLLSAEIAAGQDKPDEARRMYDQAVAAMPNNAAAFYRRGEFSMARGNARDAEADFNQAAKLAGGVGANEIRMRLVDLYMARGDIEGALDRLRTSVREDPGDTNARLRLITTLLSRGDAGRSEALDLIEDAAQKYPDNQAWMLTAADVMQQLGRSDDVERYARKAWEIQPTRDAATRYCRALLNKQPPDTQAASKVLADPALDVDKDLALRMMRGWVLVKQGKINEGLADLKATTAIVPQDNRQAVATFTEGLGQIFTSAQDRFVAWERLKPEGGYTSWMRIALAGLELTDPARVDSAMADIEGLAERTQDVDVRATAYRMLGTVAYSQKRYEDAVKWFRASVELNENDAEALNNLAYTLAADLGRPEEAVEYAQRAVKLSPKAAMLYDTLGTIQLSLNRLDEAEASMGKAAAYARGDGELAPTYLHTAEVKLAKKDVMEARRQLGLLDEVLNRSAEARAQYGEKAEELRAKLGS